MFWRMTAQRLIVESGNKAIAPKLYELVRNTGVDEININGGAVHALWTLHGLGLLDGSNAEALSVAEVALRHPAPGVRKAALQVLPPTEKTSAVIQRASMLAETNLNTRLAAILAIADLPQNDALGVELLAAQKKPENANDKWIALALDVAIAKHVKGSAEGIIAKNKEKAESDALARMPANRVQTVKIGVIKNEMKFDIKNFTAAAGSVVEFEFTNPDFMQHNLLVLQKGSLNKVGEAADKLAQDPKGIDMNYIPKMPEVLFATKLINPNETIKLRFRVPAETGEYPFICSFPGHWRIMNGTMTVTPAPARPAR
jgi:azurin